MKSCRFFAVIMTIALSIGIFGGCSKDGIFTTETEATRVLPEVDTEVLPDTEIFDLSKGRSVYEKSIAADFGEMEYSFSVKRNKFFEEQEKAQKPYECRAFGGNVYVYTEDGDRRLLVLDTDSNIQREINIDEYWNSFFPDVPRADISDHPQTDFNNFVLQISKGILIGYGRCYCYVDLFDGSVNKVVIDHDYWSSVCTRDHLTVLTREGDSTYLEIFSKDGEKSIVDVSDMIIAGDEWYTEDAYNCSDWDMVYFRIVDIYRELYGTLMIDEYDMSIRYEEAVDGYDPLYANDHQKLYYLDRVKAQENGGYFLDLHTLLYTPEGEDYELVMELTEIPELIDFMMGLDSNIGYEDLEYIGKSEDEYYILERKSGNIITIGTHKTDKKVINVLLDASKFNIPYYIDVNLRDLILEFNANSDEYYCRYIQVKFDDKDYESEMMAALRSDDPPDIVITAFHCSFLDDSGYFADLSSFAEENIDKEKYYTSVIEGSRSFRDGKLYSLPLSFAVQTITWEKNGKSGATFEEYMKKISEERYDPIWEVYDIKDQTAQAGYLTDVYAYQSDLFRKNGEYDVNTESFYKMLEFVKNNNYARYTLASDQQFDFKAGAGLQTEISACGEDITAEYYPTRITPENNLNGYPTADGRGPGLLAMMCVLVNKEAENDPGVTEFLKYSVSPVGQYLIGSRCIPIFNDYAEMYDTNMTYVPKVAMFGGNKNIEPIYVATHGGPPVVASELDKVKEMIGNLYVLPPIDPSINMIIEEESIDYLNDIDNVITPELVVAKINARIDKLMEERGTR